ncbi:diguanylate cyclase (GGDEF) domain-containing protein [Hoeflea sp. IMCC20628]|uniref:putative bifunctional diguanylate cyclase/phosphodiesterase n=1 Tax=Hoeflea sp. IMCC20628 TaxID=1620421 RepID=UPI00063BE6AF|nr:bifunctional diguanylate cyclase/phosphodiesterase [Hoeflea sp. IMCC20628]AKH99218.1 diguanylate cyclase (GGDEF) domain-containing protein [Hoeflea sp. IMCC20628]
MNISAFTTPAVRLHERLAVYAHPSAHVDNRAAQEFTGRFVSVIILAILVIPIFVVQFSLSGYPIVAAAMALCGAAMISTLWIYRIFGRSYIAGNLYIAFLFIFLTWQITHIDNIFAPGMAWYVSIPIISVLLSGYYYGFAWLFIVMVASLSTYISVAKDKVGAYDLHSFEFLYISSLITLEISVFIFISMIESARAAYHRRLERVNGIMKIRAETDELTSLYNRRAFNKLLIERSRRLPTDDQIVVMLFDIDGFKNINDTFGHDVGDKLLKKVAEELQAISSSHEGILARLGGDEFAMVISGEHLHSKAKAATTGALAIVHETIEVEGRHVDIGLSVGVAFGDASVDATELLHQADIAMYEAKRSGRSRTCEYDTALASNRRLRTELAEELRLAVREGRIEVAYQPIVDAKTRKLTGIEALCRWTRDNGSSVPPDEFIPIAEEYGLINDLGLHVLRTAARNALGWPDLKLSVNLSPVQFRCSTLVEDILRVLDEEGFPFERLELEVTEGWLIDNEDRAQPLITALQSVGITIALDDFGTGYSSIGYLRKYQFRRLKIDKSLVNNLIGDQKAQSIIQAIVLLAEGLSLAVTAEGVEKEEQARILHLIGCSNLQGYHFGKPQSASDIDLLCDRPKSSRPLLADIR